MREEPTSTFHGNSKNEIVWEGKANTKPFGNLDGGNPFMAGGVLYMKTNAAIHSHNAVRLVDGIQFTFASSDQCIPKQISIIIKEDK